MAKLKFCVLAQTEEKERAWVRELIQEISPWVEVSGVTSQEKSLNASGELQLILIDAEHSDLDKILENFEQRLPLSSSFPFVVQREKQLVFLVLPNQKGGAPFWAPFLERVDDLMIRPFRPLEVLTKFQMIEARLRWREVGAVNESLSQVIEGFENNLEVAEKIQRASQPKRFPQVKGLKIESRYFAGAASGGDYMDVVELKNQSDVLLILANASSYRLSSAFPQVLASVIHELASSEDTSALRNLPLLVEKVLYELTPKFLKDTDELSFWIGWLSRKEGVLRYVNAGPLVALYSRGVGQVVEVLKSEGESLTLENLVRVSSLLKVGEASLASGGRLVLFSRGFQEVLGSAPSLVQFFQDYREKESIYSLNELAFQVRGKGIGTSELPERDCTAVAIDIEAPVVYLKSLKYK